MHIIHRPRYDQLGIIHRHMRRYVHVFVALVMDKTDNPQRWRQGDFDRTANLIKLDPLIGGCDLTAVFWHIKYQSHIFQRNNPARTGFRSYRDVIANTLIKRHNFVAQVLCRNIGSRRKSKSQTNGRAGDGKTGKVNHGKPL